MVLWFIIGLAGVLFALCVHRSVISGFIGLILGLFLGIAVVMTIQNNVWGKATPPCWGNAHGWHKVIARVGC